MDLLNFVRSVNKTSNLNLDDAQLRANATRLKMAGYEKVTASNAIEAKKLMLSFPKLKLYMPNAVDADLAEQRAIQQTTSIGVEGAFVCPRCHGAMTPVELVNHKKVGYCQADRVALPYENKEVKSK